jgi:hypothetical protein
VLSTLLLIICFQVYIAALADFGSLTYAMQTYESQNKVLGLDGHVEVDPELFHSVGLLATAEQVLITNFQG